MITLTVNGKQRELEGPIPLADFLQAINVPTQFTAVARNGRVLPREQYCQVTLQAGDVLEIVRMVGGG